MWEQIRYPLVVVAVVVVLVAMNKCGKRDEGNSGNPSRPTEKPVEVGATCQPIDSEWRTIWIADAHRGDGRRFIVRADEKLTAFVELERQVLTLTFYLPSIDRDFCR